MVSPDEPHSPVDRLWVERIAALAKLSLPPDQTQRWAQELGQIVSLVDVLREVDVEGIAPLGHPTDHTNSLRVDQPLPSLPVEQALQNAPRQDGECFLVPPVLG